MISILAAEGGYQEFVLKGGEFAILALSGLSALLALAVGLLLMKGVLAEDEGTPKMIEIATAIQEGAAAYLKRQFRTIGMVLVPLAAVVFITSTKVLKPNGEVALSFAQSGLFRTLAFVAGGVLSGLTGYIGMTLHRCGGQAQLAARRPQGGLPHRRRGRHVHRRPRPARRHGDHLPLPEHELGDPRRLRLRWLAARAVPARRWRHLHQGRRRGR